jgi:stage II sporulation protein AA (anti-sigma F factor antagonist)
MSERDRDPSDPYEGPPVFDIEVLPAPDRILLLRLEGELDVATTPRFRSEVRNGLETGVRAIVLDMEAVSFMDSSMLKELLRSHAEIAPGGGVLVLVAPQAAVRRLLDLTRTSELLEIVATREEALARAGE